MRQLSFKRHRFPPEIIRHAIWLYARFTLSFRDVEEMLSERGLVRAFVHVRDLGLDRTEDLRLVSEELPQTFLNKAFEIAGRHAAAARCVVPASPNECFRNIVAITRDRFLVPVAATRLPASCLVGMARRHALARVIVDQARQEARLGSFSAGGAVDAVRRELSLRHCQTKSA